MPTITIIDESTQAASSRWNLDLLEERMTLASFIEQRIYQEVTEYNARQTGVFRGLVQPIEAERALNGTKIRLSYHPLDWRAQYELALTAFAQRRFLVLVDDRQVTDLSAHITFHTGSSVTFLKLVPLIGG